MESAWLAAGAGGRPLAVLRVVVDADGRRLADPRIVPAALAALRSLRASRGALAEWAAAVATDSLANPTLLAGLGQRAPGAASPRPLGLAGERSR